MSKAFRAWRLVGIIVVVSLIIPTSAVQGFASSAAKPPRAVASPVRETGLFRTRITIRDTYVNLRA